MNPYRSYFENQVRSASPEQVLVMLYEGAIRFLREGKKAMEEGDSAGKLAKISRVVAILTELSNTLDFEKGGEVAENLDGLYWYMIRELTRSNAKDETRPLEVSENILVELRDAWIQAIGKKKPGPEKESREEGGEPRPKSMNAAV